MNQYLTFFIAHWELSFVFLAALVWVVVTEINSRRQDSVGIQTQEAIDLINKKSAKIFDLRKIEAFQVGHIVGAKQMTFDPSKDDVKTRLKITPQTYVLLVCYMGKTSAKIVQQLRAQGYLNTFSLNGGMNEWVKENLPLTKGK